MSVEHVFTDGALRIGLIGFSAEEEHELRLTLGRLRTPQAVWIVADALPYHALLLARGTRVDDPEHMAVLRVNLPQPPASERRIEPLWLRKPIREAVLKVALDVAVTRLRANKT